MELKKETPAEAIGQDSASTGAGIGSLNPRLDHYKESLIKLEQVMAYIRAELGKGKWKGKTKIKVEKALDRIKVCGLWLKFWYYYRVDILKLVDAHFCNIPLLCQNCARRRANKKAMEAADKISYLLNQDSGLTVSMLTLTVKNGPDLGERFDHLMSGKRKITYQMRTAKARKKQVSEFSKIEGIIGAVEVTRNKKGEWHPHIHALIFHRGDFSPLLDDQGRKVLINRRDPKTGKQGKVSVLALADEWQRMTGDSFVLDVSPISASTQDELMESCFEVFKYALKFSSMSVADVVDAWLMLSGRQMVFSAGLLWGLEKDPDTLLDEIEDDLEDEPYFEIIAKWESAISDFKREFKNAQTGETYK